MSGQPFPLSLWFVANTIKSTSHQAMTTTMTRTGKDAERYIIQSAHQLSCRKMKRNSHTQAQTIHILDLHGLLDVGQKQSDKVHSYACVSLLHVRILSNIWTHACTVTCVTVSRSDTLGPKYNWLYIQDTLVQYFLCCKCLKSSSNFTAPFNRNFVIYVIYYLMHVTKIVGEDSNDTVIILQTS